MKKLVFTLLVAALAVGAGCKDSKTQEPAEAQAQADEAGTEEQAAKTDEAAAADEAEDSAEAKAEAEAEKKAELPDDLKEGESGQYGGEFEIEGEPMTLAAALEKGAEQTGPYKVQADIEKVCKKKGCWFTLTAEDVDHPVRVKMKDYGFFVPRNVDGGAAVVEGTIEKRVVPQKEAQHYADDEAAGTGKEPEKVEGDQVQWEMMITAAQIENKS